jgi:hypothetical protein
MKDMPHAIYYWLEAYEYSQDRIENLYELVLYYREQAKHKLAHYFYTLANERKNKIKRQGDELFVFDDVYDYKLDYEFTIFGHYYNIHNENLQEKCLSVLSHTSTPEHICKSILSNYKFYDNLLCDPSICLPISTHNINILNNIGKDIIGEDSEHYPPKFKPSTPSICLDNNGRLLINKRYVNYKIDEQGNYSNEENIITKNIFAKINIDSTNWKVTDEFLVGYNKGYDNKGVGLEDIRILCHNDDVHFNANRFVISEDIKQLVIVIENGIIDSKNKKVVSKFIFKEGGNLPVEKNWVLCKSNGATKTIYQWYPLTVGDIIDTQFIITHEIKTPTFFKWLRGSTNGVNINGEIWFICHIVSYETRRYYYHVFVVLDENTYEVKKYSRLFTFEKSPVEYTLGFVYFKNSFLIGYSIMDRETKFIQVPKKHVDSLFYQHQYI